MRTGRLQKPTALNVTSNPLHWIHNALSTFEYLHSSKIEWHEKCKQKRFSFTLKFALLSSHHILITTYSYFNVMYFSFATTSEYIFWFNVSLEFLYMQKGFNCVHKLKKVIFVHLSIHICLLKDKLLHTWF